MEERYSWKQMPENYNASYYNDKDLKLDRKFVIIDNLTHREYTFPTYQKREYRTVNMIDNSLWNQSFFNWICSTSPDFCIHIPKEFMTPELIDICINNTSKADFAYEIPNMTQEQSIRFVRRLPEAICTIKSGYITAEMIREALEKQPNVLITIDGYYGVREVVKKMVDKDTLKKCYEQLDIESRVQLIKRGNMVKDILTTEIVEELLNGEFIEFGKGSINDSKIIPYFSIPQNAINDNIANKMFEGDSHSLKIIPEEFITYEMCVKSVMDDRTMISHVPTKFQTPQIHKIAIDADSRIISSIPEDFLTDEIIIYALNKNGIALGGIPEPRRTPDLCEIAVANNAKALRYVPNKYKTYEMCKNAIMFNPKLIKAVPVEIMTRQFVEEIKSMNIIIDNKDLGYIQECIKAHDKMDSFLNPNKENEDAQIEENDILQDFNNISINNLSMYFTHPILQLLEKLNIKTLGQLFKESQQPNFITNIQKSAVHQELMGTIKLLRCKYLKYDPLIDINDEEMTVLEMSASLGLSTRAYNGLKRGGILYDVNVKQFFEKMRDPSIRLKLQRVRNLGEAAITEILLKVGIVIDYYDNVKNKSENIVTAENGKIEEINPTLTEADTLESLNAELQRLREERKRIDAQTDIILAKIQEKMLEQSKGGVSK